MVKKVRLSIVIPTYNEGKYINNLLESIFNQDFKDFEVIIADGNSSDDTIEIAKRYKGIKIIKNKKSVAIARNAGAKLAKASVIYFLDADTVVEPHTLANVNNTFKEKIACATGPINVLGKSSFSIKLWYWFNYYLLVKLSMLLGKPSFIGSNLAVARDVFLKSGGFNVNLRTYEDCDFSIRASAYGKVEFKKGIKIQASDRRIKKWGLLHYIKFTAINAYKYYVKKKPSLTYEPVR
ncbi:MAG: glycosyltransferase [Candidatus Micrarchaeaceae archaeon]